jgi:hypothetical protein
LGSLPAPAGEHELAAAFGSGHRAGVEGGHRRDQQHQRDDHPLRLGVLLTLCLDVVEVRRP